jgi:hypothetical protein
VKVKATVHYWLSVIMAVSALLLGTSAFLLWFVFPRGYLLSRSIWVEVHKWVGVALAIAVVLHIVLHWKWLVKMTRYYVSSQHGKIASVDED